MNNDIAETISSLKSIVETTQAQLSALEQESNPNQELLTNVRKNHDRALNILRDLSQLGTKAPTKQQATLQPEVKFPTDDETNLTREEYRKRLKRQK